MGFGFITPADEEQKSACGLHFSAMQYGFQSEVLHAFIRADTKNLGMRCSQPED